jgi:hypothetical protein
MIKILSAAIVLLVLLAACAPPVTDTELPATDTPGPQPSDARPEPKQDEVVRGLAPVDEIEILMLESFPVQVNVIVRGYLPDACTELDEITQAHAGDLFNLTLTTVRPKDLACAEVISPYQEVIALEVVGLDAGVYSVDANGVSDTFELQVDNKLPGDDDSFVSPSPGTDPGETEKTTMIIGTAPVERIKVEVVGSDPLQAQAVVVGYLPDGCTELGEVIQEWHGDTLSVTLTSRRPEGMACITMITPFEEVIPLEVSGLAAGTYAVEVNSITATLTIP